MTTLIVTFEVGNASRKSDLKKKMREQYEAICPIHENCWAIVSDQSPSQVREFLDESLLASDRIFIIRSGTHAAWKNVYGKENSEWLKERL